MSSQRAPVKDVLARQRQEIKVLKLNLSKIESMKQNVEKDLSLALLNHKKSGGKIEQLQLENQELKDLVEMKSNFIQEIHDKGSLAATAGVLTHQHKQTLMYLETIQRLSMYIVRKFKNDERGINSSTQLDQETINNIRRLMDEHVFDLLDKTEMRVLTLKKENIELLEELV